MALIVDDAEFRSKSVLASQVKPDHLIAVPVGKGS
jgi:hypothetical protein